MVQTIGVAVGIPEPWASQLGAYRAEAGDPMAALTPAHVTLLGPTDVDDSPGTQEAIEHHLASVATRHRRFAVHLRGTGTFRPLTQVVFVALSTGIHECSELAADIRSGPLSRDVPFPYHPHVTVAHDVPDEALDAVSARLTDFTAEFVIDRFTLYRHRPDGRWQPRRTFDLG